MAKIILKCMYLQPGMKNHSKNIINYIAQRDNVDKIDDSWKYLPVSISQKLLIDQLLEDFPDAKSSFEYRDYIHAQNKGNASQFITRTLEDNYDRIGTRDNYLRYIAYRPGAERVGLHGLFTDANVPIDLEEVATEVSTHKGRVWTDIVSIRREDAARLGYETGDAWRSLIRGQAQKIAECMKIPREDLRWYAAFHNESHHPHVHIVAYSVGKEPYLSKQGIRDLKSSLAREIFKQDLMQTYETQTQYRNRMTEETRDKVQKIVGEINHGTYENPTLSLMIRNLAEITQHTKGKMVYGYLPQTARNLVNNIVDELAKDERLSELYSLWYQQRDIVVQTYHDKGEERIPLSQNKTFHAIRNIVVAEVLNISTDSLAMDTAVDLPDEPAEEIHVPISEIEPEKFTLPVHTENKPDYEITHPDEDSEANSNQAVESLEWSAEQGSPYATYLLGKACLSGEDIPQDIDRAIQLLTDAAEGGLDTAMYALAKLYLADELVPMDKEKAIHWLNKAVALDNQYAQYQLGKMLLFGQGIDRDIDEGKNLLHQSAAQGNEYAQQILNNYGRTPIALAGFRLLSSLAQMFQDKIEQEQQQNSNLIDRKLRQKIEEKKQAQGLKMG